MSSYTFTADAKTLKKHVHVLAAEIGERNVWRPAALAAARELRSSSGGAGPGPCRRRPALRGGGRGFGKPRSLDPGHDEAGRGHRRGAHYDSVQGSPGADDDASAVAALLEDLAPALRHPHGAHAAGWSHSSTRNRRSSSGATSAAPSMRKRRAAAATISARCSRSKCSVATATSATASTTRRCCGISTPTAAISSPWYRISVRAPCSNRRSRPSADSRISPPSPPRCRHGSPASPGATSSRSGAGYRGVMVTDTAFFRYPYYHTAFDTPDRLDYARLRA